MTYMIDDMSDQEKSNLLFGAMGWKSYRVEGGYVINAVQGQDISAEAKRYGVMEEQVRPNPMPDLYGPANMALAKRAILWGYNFIPAFQKWLHKDGCALAVLIGVGGYNLALDRMVLELQIEAGRAETGPDQGTR